MAAAAALQKGAQGSTGASQPPAVEDNAAAGATQPRPGPPAPAQQQPGSNPVTGPAANADYLKPSYWDQRFERELQYEWLSGYTPEFRALLHQHVPTSARVLILGNGTSQLPLDMARDGFSSIVATDLSSLAVQTMRETAAQQGLHDIQWQPADMLSLPFEPGSFDAVIEKGTLDVLFVDADSPWHTAPEVQQRVDTVLSEVSRVLGPSGVFVSLSFAQPHFRLPALLRAPSELVALKPQVLGQQGCLENFGYVLGKGCDQDTGHVRALQYSPEQYATLPAHNHMDDEVAFLGAMTL